MCVCVCVCVCACACTHSHCRTQKNVPDCPSVYVCVHTHCVELRNAPDIVITLKARGAKWLVPKFSSDGENLPQPESVYQSALVQRRVVSGCWLVRTWAVLVQGLDWKEPCRVLTVFGGRQAPEAEGTVPVRAEPACPRPSSCCSRH